MPLFLGIFGSVIKRLVPKVKAFFGTIFCMIFVSPKNDHENGAKF